LLCIELGSIDISWTGIALSQTAIKQDVPNQGLIGGALWGITSKRTSWVLAGNGGSGRVCRPNTQACS
jgi:hypothetical protein